jgi:hypothetical protein
VTLTFILEVIAANCMVVCRVDLAGDIHLLEVMLFALFQYFYNIFD